MLDNVGVVSPIFNPFMWMKLWPEANAFASSAGVAQIALQPCAVMAVAIVPSQALSPPWGEINMDHMDVVIIFWFSNMKNGWLFI